MSEVPVPHLFESASHEVTPARHNLWVHAQFVGALAVQMCSDSKHSYKMCKPRTSQCVPTTQKNLWVRKIVKHNVPETFLQNV